ncbi:MAG: alpha amylase C-terminal domain-containing protein [Lentimicrobium sp.]|nr:alpha amylase C-terminal domain-containing protein [Lentimicrobium sp.]
MNSKSFLVFILPIIFTTGLSTSCRFLKKEKTEVKPIVQVQQAEWSKNLSIYEINIRQFTKDGTFTSLEAHLPRLKELGTDIIWLMPIHPIGELNRKGTLGSYYSIKDYKGVNPEFGTPEDFKNFVKKAHELGLYVIIDWVANHSSWDNPLVTEKPDFYKKDSVGNMISPYDWTDVVAFNYDNPEVGDYMLGAMKYWVEEFDIDGYRCDVAELVPAAFWDRTRAVLDKIKPVFMLAEGEKPWLHTAFDMTYGWEFHNIKNRIAKGEATANDIETYLKKNDTLYPQGSYRMYFITNHDENSWNGTEFERMGDGVKAFFVLTATVPGMPLVYTGQESGLNKRLEFFEKDAVDWGSYEMADFYEKLLKLKKENPALFNGHWGGNWQRINTDDDENIFAFIREKDENKVFTILNLNAEPTRFILNGSTYSGEYTELFTGEIRTFQENSELELPAWGYLVYFK